MRPVQRSLAILAAAITLLPAAASAAVSAKGTDPLPGNLKRADAFVARMARVNGCILNTRHVDRMIPFSTPTGYNPWAVPTMPGDDGGCSRPFRIGGWRTDDKGRLAVTVDFVSPSGHYTRVTYHLQEFRDGSFLAVFEPG